MTASEIIRLLNQVPPRYELVVTQGDTTHRILDLSYSHSPAQVTLRLVEASIPPVSATPKPSPSFAHWWEQEGSGMAPQPGEDHSEHVRRLCEIAWSNGEYVQKYPTPEAACLPEPEATIAELNGEVLVEHITEVAPLPEPDAGEVQHARTHPDEVAAPIGTAPAKRTRKPKSAPFATGDSRPADGARAPFGTA